MQWQKTSEGSSSSSSNDNERQSLKLFFKSSPNKTKQSTNQATNSNNSHFFPSLFLFLFMARGKNLVFLKNGNPSVCRPKSVARHNFCGGPPPPPLPPPLLSLFFLLLRPLFAMSSDLNYFYYYFFFFFSTPISIFLLRHHHGRCLYLLFNHTMLLHQLLLGYQAHFYRSPGLLFLIYDPLVASFGSCVPYELCVVYIYIHIYPCTQYIVRDIYTAYGR